MNEQTKNFEAGQQVVRETSRRYGRGINREVVTIKAIWQNGVIATTDGRQYREDGRGRGSTGGQLRHFAEGETAETIAADKEAKYNAEKATEEAKKAEHDAAVDVWWEAEGSAMYLAAVACQNPAGQFLGHDVLILRYERRGETWMPFVILSERKTWRGEAEIEATVGGLCGRRCVTGEADAREETTNISTYSQSTVRGESIQDVLYKITH